MDQTILAKANELYHQRLNDSVPFYQCHAITEEIKPGVLRILSSDTDIKPGIAGIYHYNTELQYSDEGLFDGYYGIRVIAPYLEEYHLYICYYNLNLGIYIPVNFLGTFK